MPILCRYCLDKYAQIYGPFRRDANNVVHFFAHDDRWTDPFKECPTCDGEGDQEEAQTPEPDVPASDQSKPESKVHPIPTHKLL